MSSSPPDITFLTMVPALLATEYAEATRRINTLGLEAMITT